MILYFTGTGNSRYIADGLADKLEDTVVSLNDVMKKQQESRFISDKPFVIVAPIYAWRLPLVVEQLLQKATFEGNAKVYIVPTMQSQTGKAEIYCKKIFEDKGMIFMGLCGIAMPNNYTFDRNIDNPKIIHSIITKAREEINRLAKCIQQEEHITKTDHVVFENILTGPVNSLFYKFYVNDKRFKVNDQCISCGLCVKLCPLNNITLENKKPVFHGNCTNCYSCIHHCPKKAINFSKSTEKYGRYICEEYK